SSAIRLVTYAGGAPLICGLEVQETRPNEFTHIFAHPELARIPIIGPCMGVDQELIMAAVQDVIFMT
ncbi:ABC transporter substrate-binding protein, partial [Odoribacter splanchnicus]|nr:ABC transporter substrate-binding protein [Odoribacter splanchnicus]